MYQYLLTPPEDLTEAADFGLPLVHLAFSLGADGLLHHPGLPEACRGGLMLAGCRETPEDGSPDRAVRQVLALCRERGFRGLVLDGEGPPTPYLSRLIQGLDRGLERLGRGFFLPESYAAFSRRAFLYLSSAISGGSLEERIRAAGETYGARRLVLALDRRAESFPLPAPEGAGEPLSREELDQLLDRLQPQVRLSQDLCAHYFTYMDRKEGPRFVLFHREDSLRQAREIGASLGVTRFFLLYPQLKDLLPTLIA